MEIATAREIITRAKKDDTYNGPMPEDDATAIKEAAQLVEMAEQAWTQQIQGPEVEAILTIANGGKNPKGGRIEAESEEPTSDTESPVIEFDEKLTKKEPWDGYGDMTVSDVTEGIAWYIEEKPADLVELITHVYAYEQAHKNRVRILKVAIEALEQLGVKIGTQEEGTPETDDSDPAESEADGEGAPGADAEGDEGAGDIGSGDDEPAEGSPEESDAGTDSSSEVGESGKESGSEGDEDKPDSENRSEPSVYRRLIEGVENDLRNERLDGIPKPPTEEAPELPWKWNEISDGDLRDFHMQYAALAFYKSYAYSRDERIAMTCREAADEIRNKLLVAAPKYDEKNKEIKVTVLDAQIESDQRVRRWRRLQRKHEQMALQAKREMESYQKLVEALSRLETMRHNAWERGRH